VQGGIIGRQSETQEIAGVIERPRPDVVLGQLRMDRAGVAVAREAEQRCAADDVEVGSAQNGVESPGLTREAIACRVDPALVAQRCLTDSKCRPGHRPRSERCGDIGDQIRPSDRKAEPQPGKAKEFAERAQHDDRQLAGKLDGAAMRRNVGEGFVDDEATAESAEVLRRCRDDFMIDDAAIGIVRIDHDGVRHAGRKQVEAGREHLSPGAHKCRGVLTVGRTRDRDPAPCHYMWKHLNQRLRARGDHNICASRNIVGCAGGFDQVALGSAFRQALPGSRRHRGRHRIWPGVDPGRQIEPGFRVTAKLRDRFAEVAAMFHGRVMPLSRGLREGCAALGVLVLCLLYGTAASALDKPRIASINVCTDQLLLTLADPEQIVGLSPYSRDPARSWAAPEASRYPRLSGEAEDVLVLKPDIVVAGRFTKRATRELLKTEGFRVEEFDAVRSLDDTRRQILRMGEIVGHPERAAAAVARIDTAVARTKEAVARKPLRVLSLSRRGWVSGGDSLTSSLLATVGLANAASQLGYKLGGFASLETIVNLKPDLLLLSDKGDFAEDQGTAFLLHPALEQLYPPDKRIVIPERLTVCGGPMLADALTRLVSEVERVEH
jgi:iron complex transport system substrate-binding protein